MKMSVYPAGSSCRKILEVGINYLRRRGVTHARYSAEVLLASCLALARAQLYLSSSRSLSPEEEECFFRLLSRRSGRTPLAYLTGTAGFYNLELRADRRALIPRPETELLVEECLDRIPAVGSGPCRVLDLGCGGGAIALALAAETDAEIFASDLSAPALDLARENAFCLDLTGRVRFLQGDFFQPWRDSPPGGFDLIVSNPPYVSGSEIDRLPDEVRLHEPLLALSGGRDGLTVIRRLIEESPLYLRPDGFLVFEIGAGQAIQVNELIISNNYFCPLKIIKDYNEHDRVIVAQKIIYQH